MLSSACLYGIQKGETAWSQGLLDFLWEKENVREFSPFITLAICIKELQFDCVTVSCGLLNYTVKIIRKMYGNKMPAVIAKILR